MPRRSFYGDLAGWTTAEFMEGYRIFNAGETGVGGLMKERGGSPVAYWMTYFAVDDTDAVAAKAMDLGAGVILPPNRWSVGRYAVLTDPIGRYAVLTDPGGAAFGPAPGAVRGRTAGSRRSSGSSRRGSRAPRSARA